MNYGNGLRVIPDPPQDAFTNMAVDEAIARATAGSDNGAMSTLRVYTWRPGSVSIGYFQKISDVVRYIGPSVSKKDLDIVRRPTGGTAVVHDYGTSFSLILKDGRRMPSMRIVNLYSLLGSCVVESLGHLGVSAELWEGPKAPASAVNGSDLCTSTLCLYDVVYGGRKIAGYAARRFQGITLLQGYVALTDGITARELGEVLMAKIASATGTRPHKDTLTREENALATKLREDKYIRREWNYKR